MRKNEPVIEVLPSTSEMVRARSGVDESELHRLVQVQVAEIMAARDAFVFEPFFRSRQVAYELKRLQRVPEQRTNAISFERYGCMICETRDRIHGGHGMCVACNAKWFRRRAQIVAEGINYQPAQAARGTTREQRLLPENAPRDGVHQTCYNRSNATEQALYERVAVKLGLTYAYVRSVAIGSRHSETVSAALKEERVRQRLFDGEK
jgi:hypothetical protein